MRAASSSGSMNDFQSSALLTQNSALSGQRVTVMGLGRFGGGVGAVQFLLQRGARVTVTDLQSRTELEQSLAEIDLPQLEGLVLECHREEDFRNADLIVVNPAVRRTENRYIRTAVEAGIPLTSEMNLFWQFCRGKKLVVTGSVGKSTTAKLIHDSLCAAGIPARLGGNIGISLLPEVELIQPNDWIVLELSSFQLADLARIHAAPEVSVITNFFPNHLDWHGTLAAYRRAKQAASTWQSSSSVAVLNADDPGVWTWPTEAARVGFGTTLPDNACGVRIDERFLLVNNKGRTQNINTESFASSLQAPHQRLNCAAAVAALTFGVGIEPERFLTAFEVYQPLRHRLEHVAEIDGRMFLNDSKATTPEATCAALRTLSSPVILIAGGQDKGVDLSVLAAEIGGHAKAVALIGPTAAVLKKGIRRSWPEFPVHLAKDLEDALAWSLARSQRGDAILLSPGCASHGEFANYEDRGETFCRLIQALREATDETSKPVP